MRYVANNKTLKIRRARKFQKLVCKIRVVKYMMRFAKILVIFQTLAYLHIFKQTSQLYI